MSIILFLLFNFFLGFFISLGYGFTARLLELIENLFKLSKLVVYYDGF